MAVDLRHAERTHICINMCTFQVVVLERQFVYNFRNNSSDELIFLYASRIAQMDKQEEDEQMAAIKTLHGKEQPARECVFYIFL
jgi:hypothetical protein